MATQPRPGMPLAIRARNGRPVGRARQLPATAPAPFRRGTELLLRTAALPAHPWAGDLGMCAIVYEAAAAQMLFSRLSVKRSCKTKIWRGLCTMPVACECYAASKSSQIQSQAVVQIKEKSRDHSGHSIGAHTLDHTANNLRYHEKNLIKYLFNNQLQSTE